jgi:hypothetical protein
MSMSVPGSGSVTNEQGSFVVDSDIEIRTADGVDFEREFAEFFRVSKDPLYRMAYLLSGALHRAEDLVQQASERTRRSWRSARGPTGVVATSPGKPADRRVAPYPPGSADRD